LEYSWHLFYVLLSLINSFLSRRIRSDNRCLKYGLVFVLYSAIGVNFRPGQRSYPHYFSVTWGPPCWRTAQKKVSYVNFLYIFIYLYQYQHCSPRPSSWFLGDRKGGDGRGREVKNGGKGREDPTKFGNKSTPTWSAVLNTVLGALQNWNCAVITWVIVSADYERNKHCHCLAVQAENWCQVKERLVFGVLYRWTLETMFVE